MPILQIPAMIEDNYPIDVIYIIGSGRSGSTLLGTVLGSYPEVVNTGEIYNFKHFFDTAAEYDRKCSCGQKLLECDYWKNVRSNLQKLTGRDLVEPKDTDLSSFENNNAALFSSIQAVADKKIILDSSKRHYRLSLLLRSPLFKVTIVHLVRDARAYAFSSMLTEMRKGASAWVFYRKLWHWQYKNLTMKFLYSRLPRYYFCRYEDFVRDPRAIAGEIIALAGINRVDDSGIPVNKSEEHQFSGNTRVFTQGEINIRKDTRYIELLSKFHWMAGTVLAVFALILFRYPMTRKIM